MGSNEAASFLSGSSVCHKDVSGPGEYVAVDWYDSPAVFKTVDSIAIVDEAARAHQWHEIYFFPVNRTGMIAWSAKRAQERQWIPLTAMENAINSHQ
jgi:hypothetical protein